MRRLGSGGSAGPFEGLHCLRVHDPNDTGYDARGPYSPDDVDACLAPGGHLEGMVALRTAGKIKEVSLGMNSVGFNEVGEDRAENVLRLIKGAPLGTFDSALLAYGYNLFNQDGLEILEECEARGIAVHVAGAFMLGVFNTGTCCLGLKALTYPLRSPCFTGSSFLKSAPGAHGVSAQFGDYTTTELESCWPRLARDSWTQWRFFVRLKLGIVIDLEQRPLSLSD